MFRMFDRLPVWEKAGEGEGGGVDTEAEKGEDAASSQEGAGDNSEDGTRESSILDFSDKKSPDGKDSEKGDKSDWTAPEGLPDHLRGDDADATLAKVLKAYTGARKELSTKGKSGLEGTVPEKPDGYKFEAEGEDDTIAAELNDERNKPIVDAFRASAHKYGIPDKAFTAMMREGLAGVAESTGLQFGLSSEEQQKINGEAEMEALTKEVGSKEAQTMVNTIAAFGEKLADLGAIQDEADVAEFAAMVGTARSARIFHRMLTGYLGEKPIPPGDGAEGRLTKTEALAKHQEALSMKAGPARDAALAAAEKAMQDTFGNEPASSVRSNIHS